MTHWNNVSEVSHSSRSLCPKDQGKSTGIPQLDSMFNSNYPHFVNRLVNILTNGKYLSIRSEKMGVRC